MWINLADSELRVIKRLLEKSKKKEAAQVLSHLVESEEESERAELYREAAAKKSSAALEVDAEAVVSEGSDPGAYVMAWLWVSDEELPGPREWSPRGS